MLETGSPAHTLLSDNVYTRSRIEEVKLILRQGPTWLTAICVGLCLAATMYDIVAIVSEVVHLEPLQMVTTGYALVIVVIMAFIDLKLAFLPWLRKWCNIWLKFFNRIIGRGVVLMLAGGLHISIRTIYGYIFGCLLVLTGIVYFVLSRHYSFKLERLFDELTASHTDDLVHVRQTFNRADTSKSGLVSIARLVGVAKDLGSELTPAELYSFFEYLSDEDDDSLSYHEFEAFWVGERKKLDNFWLPVL